MKIWAKKTRRILKKVLSFGNALLLATVLASILSFYYSYYTGFESVNEIRKVTQAQFSSTLSDDVKSHMENIISATHRADVSVQQGYYSQIVTLDEVINFQKHAWQVFDVGVKYGLSSYYLGNDDGVQIGYSAAPLSAFIQYPGLDYMYVLPILDNLGTFNYSDLAEAAIYTLPIFSTDWPPYKEAKDLAMPIFSEPYILDPELPVVLMTFGNPINYPNGTFCCVAFVDIELNSFVSYLSSLPIVVQAKGSAMLVDINLALIATSNPNQETLTLNLSSPTFGDRIMGYDVSDPILAEAARYLREHYEDGKPVNITTQIHTSKGKYFFQSSTIYIPDGDKTMVLITMQPRSYYFAKIDKMQVLIIIFSVFSLFTGFLYRLFPVVKIWRERNKISSASNKDMPNDVGREVGRARNESISMPLSSSAGSETELLGQTPGRVEGGVTLGMNNLGTLNNSSDNNNSPPSSPPLPLPLPRLLPPLQSSVSSIPLGK